jgi:hypothetical protein
MNSSECVVVGSIILMTVGRAELQTSDFRTKKQYSIFQRSMVYLNVSPGPSSRMSSRKTRSSPEDVHAPSKEPIEPDASAEDEEAKCCKDRALINANQMHCLCVET